MRMCACVLMCARVCGKVRMCAHVRACVRMCAFRGRRAEGAAPRLHDSEEIIADGKLDVMRLGDFVARQAAGPPTRQRRQALAMQRHPPSAPDT